MARNRIGRRFEEATLVTSVVVLGGGFAGLTVARRLERLTSADHVSITVVSRENFTLFTPMLPEVCSGGIEPRHIVTPLRAALHRSAFVLGNVEAIDLHEHSVTIRHPHETAPREIRYDHLVIALGGETSTFGIPGVAERALPFKSLDDAETLRNEVISNLERAHVTTDERERRRLLNFAIVGGGFTGVEVAGELAEFLHSVRAFYGSTVDLAKITIVDGGARLLPELPAGVGDYAGHNLAARGVDVRLHCNVTEASDEGVTLSDGTMIEAATLVWSAGVRPTRLVADLPTEHLKNGSIVVDRDLAVDGHPGTWALGDCAAIPMEGGGYYPPTAQHAIREAELLAKNIASACRGEATQPFRFASLGSMASLGARRGVALLPGGLLITGFLAWFLWRSYYLSRLPGWDRRARVAFDWTAGLVFPRDIAHLRVYTDHARENRSLPKTTPVSTAL